MKTNFSPTEAINFGWNKFKENKKFWVIAVFLIFMMSGYGRGGYSTGRNTSSNIEYSRPAEQTTQPNVTNQFNINNNQQIQIEDVKKENLPLIPKKVDEVLGISDQRDNGNTFMFIVLFVVAVVIFALPFIIASILVSGVIQMGIVKFFLSAARGTGTKYELLLSEVKLGKSFRFLAASFLYVLLVILGLIFFIIPGIYFGIKYKFVTYAIVDRDVKISEAFRLSAKFTKGNKWKLIGFGFLILFVNLLGLLALVYGLLVSIPVTAIASAYAYDRLSKTA